MDLPVRRFTGKCHGYNTSFCISATIDTCSICLNCKPVVEMDGSNGEYFNGCACLDCLHALVADLGKYL